jgi:hypothetical protein
MYRINNERKRFLLDKKPTIVKEDADKQRIISCSDNIIRITPFDSCITWFSTKILLEENGHKNFESQLLVAYTCNPSYSGG